jgi:hypothetical protein
VLLEIHAACNLLSDFKLEALKREANIMAHELPKHTRDAQECVVQCFDCPDSVRRLVGKEAPYGATP